MRTVVVLLLVLMSTGLRSQVDSVLFTERGNHQYTFFYSAFTSVFDRLDRPYVYGASMELGIVCFDVSDLDNPIPVDTLPTSALGNLNATNLWIESNRLYASLGGFQGIAQNPGLAIIDLDDPENLEILGMWSSTDYNQGAAVVLIHDTLAFIGAMDSGVITLDISDESQPVFVSHILPFVDFPEPPGLFSVPNARGLDYRDHILFVCYDAGGLRAIDMTDPYNPEEVGMYVNEGIESTAQSAYNNCKVLGDLCFVPVDYCGLDIVEVTDVENMTNYNWYNPWNCLPDNWDGRDGHSNQLVILPSQNLLFMSGADSELLVYDISNPDEEHLVGQYVNLGDNIACWGVDVWNNAVVLSYVNNPLGIPYDSNVGGIQILEWNTEGQSVRETDPLSAMRVFPVPASHYVTIVVNDLLVGEFLTILDTSGREMGQIAVTSTTLKVDVSSLPTGTYDMVSSLGHHRRLVVRQP